MCSYAVAAGCLNFTLLRCCQNGMEAISLLFVAAHWNSTMIFFVPSSPLLWQLPTASNTYATNTMPRVQNSFTSWRLLSCRDLPILSRRVMPWCVQMSVSMCPCVQATAWWIVDYICDFGLHISPSQRVVSVYTSPPLADSCCLRVSSSCSLSSNCWFSISRSVSRERILWKQTKNISHERMHIHTK